MARGTSVPQGFLLQFPAMPHTCVNTLHHCVFSTKERRKTLSPDLRPRLWSYLGGIARKNEMHALGVGGRIRVCAVSPQTEANNVPAE